MGRVPVVFALTAAALASALLNPAAQVSAADCSTAASCTNCPVGAECLPAPPPAVVSLGATASGGEVAVSWAPFQFSTPTGFRITASSGDQLDVGAAERTASLGGVKAGGSVTVTVVAFNSGGSSPARSVTVTSTDDAAKVAAVSTPPVVPAVGDGPTDQELQAAGVDSADTAAVAKAKVDFVLDQNDARMAQVSAAAIETRVSQFSAAKADVHAAAAYSAANGSPSFLDRSAEGEAATRYPAYTATTSAFRSRMSAAYSSRVVVARSIELIDFIAGTADDIFYPSVTDGFFTVVQWQGVTVDGGSATGLVSGYYTTRFTDSTGVVTSVDEVESQFQFSLAMEAGRWRVVTVEGTAAVEGETAAPEVSSAVPTSTSLTSTTFNRGGAYRYARRYYDDRNFYPSFTSNCTNFSSQVWHEGGGVPQSSSWYMKRMTGWGWSRSWTTVRGFRGHWYSRAWGYYYVSGRAALRARYTAANVGDVYVYDTGISRDKPTFGHTAVAFRSNRGFDEVAQNTRDAIRTWNFHYKSMAYDRRMNIERPGHGIRIIVR